MRLYCPQLLATQTKRIVWKHSAIIDVTMRNEGNETQNLASSKSLMIIHLATSEKNVSQDCMRKK